MPFMPYEEDADRRALLRNPLGGGGPAPRSRLSREQLMGVMPEGRGGRSFSFGERTGMLSDEQLRGVNPIQLPPEKTGFMGFDKDQWGTFGQAMLGLSSGLLSRGYGESGAQALGRGIQRGSAAALESGRRQRKKRTREYLQRLARSATTSPEDAELYSMLAEMENADAGMLALIQSRGANRRAELGRGDWRTKADYQDELLRGRAEEAREYRAGQPTEIDKQYAALLSNAARGEPEARKTLGLKPGTGLSKKLQAELDRYDRLTVPGLVGREVVGTLRESGFGGGGMMPGDDSL